MEEHGKRKLKFRELHRNCTLMCIENDSIFAYSVVASDVAQILARIQNALLKCLAKFIEFLSSRNFELAFKTLFEQRGERKETWDIQNTRCSR